MPPNADLTVIIVTMDTRAMTLAAIRAVTAQSEVGSMQIILVDNGSTDGTAEAVAEAFPAVRVLRNTRNEGFARAVNRGLRDASGQFVLLLNSDAQPREGMVRRMLDTMRTDNRIGIVGARLINSDGGCQNSVANTPCLLTEITKKSLLKRLFPRVFYSRQYLPAGPTDVQSVLGACMMVRRDMIKCTGLLDEAFFFYMEDSDWCLRARQSGWRVVFDPQAIAVHLQGATALSREVDSRIEYWRSRYVFFAKHRNPVSCAILDVGLLFGLLVDVMYYRLIGLATKSKNSRLNISRRLLVWHLRGRPADWGLRCAATMSPAIAATPEGDTGFVEVHSATPGGLQTTVP